MKTDLYTKILMTIFVMAFCFLSYSAYLMATKGVRADVSGSMDNTISYKKEATPSRYR
jgi:hypothetical protein